MNHPHIHFESCASTHLYAIEHARDIEDQSVITADFQSDGRGRFGRKWISKSGASLLMTMFLTPKIRPSHATLLLHVLSLSVIEFLKDLQIDAALRWPNDVVVKQKKIAGLLADASFQGGQLSHVVISVGLNVNQDISELEMIDRPATSIFIECGKREKPVTFVPPLLSHFDRLYSLFTRDGFTPLIDQWREKQMLKGKRVRLEIGEGSFEGRVVSFGEDCSIVIEDDTGIVRSFVAGEVYSLMR
jgi:BirA family biotin operon repressor/biotin-[acetyl-CoA-carboxylase] ligase